MSRPSFSRTRAIAIVGVTGVLMASPFAGAVANARTSHHASAHALKVATPKLGPGGRVIVLLRNQTTKYTAKTSAQLSQAVVGRSAEQSVANQIRSVGGTVTDTYSLINAVAATVTTAEAKALAANSNVKEIVPDEVIKEA
jgi:hypothetical protein